MVQFRLVIASSWLKAQSGPWVKRERCWVEYTEVTAGSSWAAECYVVRGKQGSIQVEPPEVAGSSEVVMRMDSCWIGAAASCSGEGCMLRRTVTGRCTSGWVEQSGVGPQQVEEAAAWAVSADMST